MKNRQKKDVTGYPLVFVVNQNDAARSNYEIIEIGSWIGGTVRLC